MARIMEKGTIYTGSVKKLHIEKKYSIYNTYSSVYSTFSTTYLGTQNFFSINLCGGKVVLSICLSVA